MREKFRPRLSSLRVCNALKIELPSKAIIIFRKSIKGALHEIFTLFYRLVT